MIKELTIQKTPNGFLPRLSLNGKWLEDVGFTVGRCVALSFIDGCIFLTVDNGADLIVESRIVRKKPRTTLTINAFHLARFGLKFGDKVGVTYEHGKITIQKIVKYVTADDLGA